jgi:rhodanese-related sulfurtransferase
VNEKDARRPEKCILLALDVKRWFCCLILTKAARNSCRERATAATGQTACRESQTGRMLSLRERSPGLPRAINQIDDQAGTNARSTYRQSFTFLEKAHRTMTEFLQQNIMLVCLFLASFVMLIWPSISKAVGGAKEVGTMEATRLMNSGDALVLDIRDNGEFNGGRIPKSKNVPLAELDKRIDDFAKFKDKPVIVTCKASGGKASAAVRLLKAKGFNNVHTLAGGFASWQQASLPVEK